MVVQSIAMRLLRLVKHVGRWRRQAWGTLSTHAGYDRVLAARMLYITMYVVISYVHMHEVARVGLRACGLRAARSAQRYRRPFSQPPFSGSGSGRIGPTD
jgi:hypothetical protein